MKKIFLLLVIILTMILPCFAYTERTFITGNEDGIIQTPEHVIIIQGYDQATVLTWLPTTDIIIVNKDYVINTEDNERADISRIYQR